MTQSQLPTIVMRVHRLDYATTNSIATEIQLLRDLQELTELDLARPIPTLRGEDIVTISTPELAERRHVVCFTYVAGTPPRDSQDDTETVGRIASAFVAVPDALSQPLFRAAARVYDAFAPVMARRATMTARDRELYQRLGAVAATFHCASTRWQPPQTYERISWDWNATFGKQWNNYYGARYQDTRVLGPKARAIIGACELRIQRRLAAYGQVPDRYGYIHSDLRLANTLLDGDTLTILDWDDFGTGWYLTDIAGIVGFQERRPDLGAVIAEIVTGYQRVRPLSAADIREIPTFVLIRRIGLLQAVLYHLDNTEAGQGESAELTPAILAFLAQGTVDLARRYLKQTEHLALATAAEI